MIIVIGPSGRNRRRRGGFSLVEMVVVCFMMALLASLMAGAWSAFGRPAADVEARCRIAQEASLAAESLARDLSGYRPGTDARPVGSAAPDDSRVGALGASKFVGRLVPENTSLWLCFDSQSSPDGLAEWASPDAVVVYQLVDDRLVRWDQQAGTAVTVARYLSGFQAIDQGGSVFLQLSFSYRRFRRTYFLIGVDP